MLWLTVVAVSAALAMGFAAWALVHRSVAVSAWVVLAAGTLSMTVTGVAAALSGAIDPVIAIGIAAGTIPASVPLTAATRIGAWSPGTMLAAASAWSGLAVPFAIVAPPAVVAACPPEVCVVEDFGGGLAFTVAAGAFLLVPSAVTVGRNWLRSGTGDLVRDIASAALLWVGFVVWLTALEGAVDAYSPLIALSAVVAPVGGAVGWLVVDRVRGVETTVARAVRIGVLAGMGAVLPGVVAMTVPWALLVGFLGGAVGALTHDARGLMSSAPGTRASVAAVAVGVIGMAAPGIVGSRLGFVFAARADVLLMQLAAVVAVGVVAVAISIPVAVLIRRRA